MNVGVIEKHLEKIESVVSCKIILDSNEAIDEIHVVSNGLRNVRQILRDIQSILIAIYDIKVDHKKISIAEILDKDLKKQNCRLQIKSVSHNNLGSRASIEVILADETREFKNQVVGVSTIRNVQRMLVDATLRNVEEACGLEDCFTLEDIRTTSISNDKATITLITCITEGIEKRLCGSSIIGNDHNLAVVKATLDALNRYIIR